MYVCKSKTYINLFKQYERERVISNCPIQVPQVLGNCTINYYGMILSMDWDLQNYICSIKKYILHRNRERKQQQTQSQEELKTSWKASIHVHVHNLNLNLNESSTIIVLEL